MLTVHHLQRSQSDRIVWLCEELGIEYDLKTYKRDARTFLSPPEVIALHETGSAPVINDGKVTLAESGAIVQYILTKYGGGKLEVSPDAENWAEYLYFLHFGNGYFQPALMVHGAKLRAGLPADDVSSKLSKHRFEKSLEILENRLSKNTWLAGEEFTAADVMNVCTLTTMRLFFPYSLEGYNSILAYLKRVSEREGYKRALAKGDPGLEPIIGAEKPDSITGRK